MQENERDITQAGKRKKNILKSSRNRYREKKLSGLQIQEFLQEINYKHTDQKVRTIEKYS